MLSLTKTNERRQMAQAKPGKPYPEFPLYAHGAGQWAKRIKGKVYYFGKWDDPEAALAKFKDEVDYLQAGKTPPEESDGATVVDLVNAFVASKRRSHDEGELAISTLRDYIETAEIFCRFFGATKLAGISATRLERLRTHYGEGVGPYTQNRHLTHTRMMIKFAYDHGLIESPIRAAGSMRRVSAKGLRLAKHEKGSRLFEGEELKRAVDKAGTTLKAIILLGVNCGLGNSDISSMPFEALDLENGWLTYPRGKTGTIRRVRLWPETVEAIRDAIASRPEPRSKTDSKIVFITKYGGRWVTETEKSVKDSVSKEFTKLLKAEGLKRPGLTFYALRHTFQTIAENGCRDPIAVKAIMGHVDGTISEHYREKVSDERLAAATDAVREWLFAEGN